MSRRIAIALAIAALLPATAEAAKFRGGRSTKPAASASRSTLIVTPGLVGAARAGELRPGEAQRVPFPAASALPQPQLLRATAEEKQPWCRSAVVVGGFCLMN